MRLARHGEEPLPGRAYLAPEGQHLRLVGSRLELGQEPPVDFQRPSGSVLLASIAASCGQDAIGTVLTGMGADGASGLLAMHRAGAFTIAEDASTAVVYGMPAAAAALNCVDEQLPITRIASRQLAVLKQAGLRTS